MVVKSEILVRVTMQLDCLKLSLNRNGKVFAVGTVSQSSAQIQYWEDDTMEIKLLFGNFIIEDPVTETRGPKDIFRVKGDHLVEVYYKSFLETDTDFAGYHSWLRVRLNSIRYIFVQSFLTELLRWFSDYSKLKSTYLAAEQNYRNKVLMIPELSRSNYSDIPLKGRMIEAQIANKPVETPNRKFKYDVLFNNPMIIIPLSPKVTIILVLSQKTHKGSYSIAM